MKGDFTRSTFDHKKHYSGVRMQQGRVQLDADWNEQVDIQTYLLEQSLEDVVGPCGAPLQNAGFGLSINDDDLMIGAGHYYVYGTLCENKNECNYLEQENIKDAKLPEEDGNYLFYLDVWQKHVTAVEDESISETALGGPDTATRTKTIWQVKYKPILSTLDDNSCIQNLTEWDDLIAERDARLKASVDPETSPTDPCIVPSGAGYRGLENHLYRVEIHKADGENTTFKWSRDNGSILRAVDEIDYENYIIKIKNAGPDILHAFEPYQWVEITDDRRELNGKPGTLVYLNEVKGGVDLKFDKDVIIGEPVNSTNYPEKDDPKVRRWDQTESGEIKIDIKKELEFGLGVEFKTDDAYESGDFWLIPARTANGDIEWSEENEGWQQRFGIEHQYCPLAIVNYLDGEWKIKDGRKVFPSLTNFTSLFYLSGDGQEAMPGHDLTQPLQVGVANGDKPVPGARVKFELNNSTVLNGTLSDDEQSSNDSITVNTGLDGVAQCFWKLGTDNSRKYQVKAYLLDACGNSVHLPIFFNANLSIAENVAYKTCTKLNSVQDNLNQTDPLWSHTDPTGNITIKEVLDAFLCTFNATHLPVNKETLCVSLKSENTVQDALNKLCSLVQFKECYVTVGENGQFETIDDALKAHLDEGHENICICLQPGEYVLSVEISGNIHLSIRGCGHGSSIITLENPLLIKDLASFTMKDVKIKFGELDSSVDEIIVFEECDEVVICSCHIIGESNADVLFKMQGVNRVYFENNVIEIYKKDVVENHRKLMPDDYNLNGLFVDFSRKNFEKNATSISNTLAGISSADRRKLTAKMNENIERVRPDNAESNKYSRFSELVAEDEMSKVEVSEAIKDLYEPIMKASSSIALLITGGSFNVNIEDNEIVGLVNLYSKNDTSDEMQFMELNDSIIKHLMDLNVGGGWLKLRGNKLTRMLIGEDIITSLFSDDFHEIFKQYSQVFFKSIFLTDNIFEGDVNLWLAQEIKMTSNRFLTEDNVAGVVIANRAIYTGNSAENDNTHLLDHSYRSAKAANLIDIK